MFTRPGNSHLWFPTSGPFHFGLGSSLGEPGSRCGSGAVTVGDLRGSGAKDGDMKKPWKNAEKPWIYSNLMGFNRDLMGIYSDLLGFIVI